ncbi:hypothetical protein KQ51_01579 [Candidatus Izimaplasma bacterium HR1]|jgi:hypothetical protein|uniref:DUF3137 domain-containing protein n=1 Tax=Candidatus Izimoplasma sp. HR1 TaxID=1541959 RepID=UPI0004F5E662|nr:hypothetical protein KQ51_01579 [Candidatus Izimaplasma bacterium HR1]
MEEMNKRKEKWDFYRSVGWVLTVVGGIAAYGGGKGGAFGVAIVGIIMFVPGAIILYYSKKKVREISNEFKTTYVKKEIEKRIPNSIFRINEGISSDVVSSSHLVKLHDRYTTEDLLIGKIENVDFRCADVHVVDIQSSGKSTRRVTTFQGRFYEFEFYKQFKSNVFLLQPGQYRPFSSFTKVKLESMKFNSEFKVYTDNEHDVFYLLTPHLMEKLLVLDRKYQDKIGFSFRNSKLYIAIDNRIDTFDVMHMGDITQKHINDAIKEIENIMEFVEFLSLTSTLFIENE